MTLHNAKGLEFRAVYLIGMEEGIFPHSRSIEEQGIEEERRLCYVGMTRAQERLTLLHASSRMLYGGRNHNLPSRFLDEVPERHVERERLRPASWSSYGAPRHSQVVPREDVPDLATGDSVRHSTLGEGVVVRIEPGGLVDGALRRRRQRAEARARVRAAREAVASGHVRGSSLRRPGRVRPRDRRDRPVLQPAARRGVLRALGAHAAARADARRLRGRPDRRRRGRVPVRALGAGRLAALRGRDRRRHPADASPPRRPPLADGRAAARRPRARRADRGALGLRGDDLRPLRLRHRLLGGRAEGPARVGRVREPARARRDDALRHARRGARAVPAGVRRGAARASGHDVAERRVVGGTPPAPGGGREGRAAPFRRARGATASRRHMRSTGRASRSRAVSRRRASSCARRSARRRRRRRRSGGSCSTSTGWPSSRCRSRRPTIRSSCSSRCPRRAQYRMGDGLWVRVVDLPARALGPRVRRGRAARARGARRGLRMERRTLAARRTARASAPTPSPTSRSTSRALGSAYLGAVSFTQLRDAVRVQELREGAIRRADALFAWRPLPWCLEIF